MRSETRKLPKGESFVLKPSILSAALGEAGVVIETHLIRNAGTLFDAHFWPRSHDFQYERLYIRAGSVQRSNAAAARAHVETEVIPRIVAWIADILSRDADSPVRREKQVMQITLQQELVE
ncbi:MAG TPA: hypothetical protein VLK25_06265 [Allosphingosinicella sp.]|nr:hypothetical protein [Allosphingosinicella sp.]